MVQGICGTLLGAYLSKRYTKVSHQTDGLVCGFGMMCTTPFLAIAIGTADINVYICWLCILIGEVPISFSTMLYLIPDICARCFCV